MRFSRLQERGAARCTQRLMSISPPNAPSKHVGRVSVEKAGNEGRPHEPHALGDTRFVRALGGLAKSVYPYQ